MNVVKYINPKKYSQYDEQRHILRAFGYDDWEVRGGRFLDIGAFNPFEFSNTRALFELGWSGVMIEPSPGPMYSLIAEYGNEPRVTLIQAAAGLAGWDNPVSLHVTDNCVSSISQIQYEHWNGAAKFNGVVLVPVVTLETIGEQFPGFDFINFDVEGYSVDLCLHAIVEMAWRPHCICVEHDGSAVLESDLLTCGYFMAYENETNMVFVRNA